LKSENFEIGETAAETEYFSNDEKSVEIPGGQ
jgi:hypothetical protein